MFIGTRSTTTEADLVVFNGQSRERKNVLLIIEAKKSDKDIKEDHIAQAKSYAQALMPACYIVTNGLKIEVFLFNGSLAPDECVMDFDRSILIEKWADLYHSASKKATIWRKIKLLTFISREHPIASS
jgi:type I site-specific restriction endonuclease